MEYQLMSCLTEVPNLSPTSSTPLVSSSEWNCISPPDTTLRAMDRWNKSTRSWSSTSGHTPTISRITGPCCCPWLSLLTTMPQVQQWGCPHFMPTRGITPDYWLKARYPHHPLGPNSLLQTWTNYTPNLNGT